MKRQRMNESEEEEEEEEVQRRIKCIISRLPCDIFFNILSRLPLESIFNCRCVCKAWLDLLLNSKFATAHLWRSPTSLILLHPKKRCLFLVDMEEGSSNIIRRREFNFDFMRQGFVIANSCNGLLCLCDLRSYEPVFVFNPITGEYTRIPRGEESDSVSECFAYSRLGFSPRTNEYKVVRFIIRSIQYPFNWETKVYTIGAKGAWRNVEGSPGINGKLPPDAFLNGSLHWVMDDCSKLEFIQSFDFRTERFRLFPPPLDLGPNHKKRIDLMSLGVLDGCLYLSDFPFTDHFDVWVMKDYGVQKSWAKEFVIQTPMAHTIWPRDSYQLISLLSNGEILILLNSKALVSYNLGKRSFQHLRRYSIGSNFEAIPHTPSFVSLKDSAMGKNLTVLNVKSRWQILYRGTRID